MFQTHGKIARIHRYDKIRAILLATRSLFLSSLQATCFDEYADFEAELVAWNGTAVKIEKVSP